MEELFAGYSALLFIGYLWMWRRGNKWKAAFHNKPVTRVVKAPPKPSVSEVDNRPKPLSDREKALRLAKRMERVGGRTWEEKVTYIKKKLLRSGHLSVQQAEKMIEEAYGVLRQSEDRPRADGPTIS